MLLKASPPWLVIASALWWVTSFGATSWMLNGGMGHPEKDMAQRVREMAALFVVGMGTFVFVEWFIHSVLFHGLKTVDRVLRLPAKQSIYYIAHGFHHHRPNLGGNRVVLPVLHQWVLVGILWCIVHVVTKPLGSQVWTTMGLGSGIMLSYASYELAHLHAHGDPIAQVFEFLEHGRLFHLSHHFQDSSKAFGFCSPVVDLLCGTLPSDPNLHPFSWQNLLDLRNPYHILGALPLPFPWWHWLMMYLARRAEERTGGAPTLPNFDKYLQVARVESKKLQ